MILTYKPVKTNKLNKVINRLVGLVLKDPQTIILRQILFIYHSIKIKYLIWPKNITNC